MDKQTKFDVNGLEPVLVVNDLRETLDYYKQVLGFSVDWIWPNEGQPDHASVSFGVSDHNDHKEGSDYQHNHIHIQLSQADDTPVDNSGWLYIHLANNVDELYNLLRDRGAEISSEINNYPWGMREFDVRDINSHIFRFGQSIVNN